MKVVNGVDRASSVHHLGSPVTLRVDGKSAIHLRSAAIASPAGQAYRVNDSGTPQSGSSLPCWRSGVSCRGTSRDSISWCLSLR